jgi:succinate dehydrogenase/fumarate reductase flavoprotein subunit
MSIMATKKQQHEARKKYHRDWYAKKHSGQTLTNNLAEKLTDLSQLTEVVKGYKILHAATKDVGLQVELTRLFTRIIAKQ